jgi:hypothetical protein
MAALRRARQSFERSRLPCAATARAASAKKFFGKARFDVENVLQEF